MLCINIIDKLVKVVMWLKNQLLLVQILLKMSKPQIRKQ